MFCPGCGTELPARSRFCYNCGGQTPTTPQASPPAPTVSQSVAPAPPPPPAAWAQPVPAPRDGLSTAGIWCIVCSIVAILVLPPISGGLAIYLAYRAKKAGDRAGDALMIGAIVATVIGMIIGAIVWTSM